MRFYQHAMRLMPRRLKEMLLRQPLREFAVIGLGVDAVASLHLIEDVSPVSVLRRNGDARRSNRVNRMFGH